MKLYFSPLSCSMATRISLYEFGIEAEYVQVDTKSADYRAINPLGLVPVLITDDGDLLTENAAILQYVAEKYGHAAWGNVLDRARLRQYLSFVGTELHQGLFKPLLSSTTPDAVKAHALTRAESRLNWVADKLTGRNYLLNDFSIADAYLFTVLKWSRATTIDLRPYAEITAFMARMRERPSVARAFAEELALYQRVAAA